VNVSKRGYQVIDNIKNKYPTAEQWTGYPYLYFPKAYILHAGFHMTPYSGPGNKEYVQLSVEERDTILNQIHD
jgi:hypothetical protein